MPGRGSQPSPAEGLRAATGSKYWSIQEEGPAPSHSSALGRLPCREDKPACAPPGSPVRKGAPHAREACAWPALAARRLLSPGADSNDCSERASRWAEAHPAVRGRVTLGAGGRTAPGRAGSSPGWRSFT